ncbi:MAG: CBS domain-containing protein [Nitrospirales bacterium]|nr:CBS domain-containing protein [Nitrospirales bacterium]
MDPQSPLAGQLVFRIIEPVGASTTVLIEQLKKLNIALTPFEATVLAIGLYEETGFLAYMSTTPRDLDAAAHVLRAGADLNMVRDTLSSHLDLALLHDLLESSETYYVEGHKVLLASSTYDQCRGDLAEAVHKLAELEGYDAVLAAICMEEKVEIIGRSRCAPIHVGRIAEALGGGGHASAASAVVKGQTLFEVKEHVARLLMDCHAPLARDVMTTPVKVITAGATVKETEHVLTKYGVNVLPVVDAHIRYQGIVTREAIQKSLFHQLGAAELHALMQTDVYTATPETSFHDIKDHMLERNQRCVPILQNSHVVGVITRTDLLRAVHRDILREVLGKRRDTFPRTRHLQALLKQRLPASLLAVLEEAGSLATRQHVSAFVVGGFVRDVLLGQPTRDLDVVIEGDAMIFARVWACQHGARVTVHEKFGTAKIIFPNGLKLDLATARLEYYEYPTALPTVERSSIKQDLSRRDFTINALAIQLNPGRFGELIDLYGGQRDIKEKKIRVLHSLSFIEDPTRVFRAIRFAERFGFELGKETLSLIKAAVAMDVFQRLSKSRVSEELILLLSEEEPSHGIAWLAELNVLRFIHPALKWSTKLESLFHSIKEVLDWYKLSYFDGSVKPWVVYFTALIDSLLKGTVEEVLKTLAIPAGDGKTIQKSQTTVHVLRRLTQCPLPRPSETYHLLEGYADETLLFLMAKSPDESVKRRVSMYLTTDRYIKPLTTGDDLKAMGFLPGPGFKRILTALLDARLDGDVQTETDERTLIKRLQNQS